ncbi:MAG TPA: type I restriction-modification system subunit M N-terminal domain-containing protein, partial [Prolixibacteraceae bacterium]|nr:type I restriction-modification system subunit M N-terminal domain-containing protein [Prolixibacteraceae bacterium]
MDQEIYNQLVSFIWNIANDVLVNTYNKGDYRKVILPMMVIRRLDAVLEPTKDAVLAMKKSLDEAGVLNQEEALCSVASQAFCNFSPFMMKQLKARTNRQQLKADFIAYLDGFSENVQDIITKFELRNQIDKLSEGGILGMLIEKFVDPKINLSTKPVLDDEGNEKLPGLDNHSMGTIFEELLRRFNEE